MKGEGVNPERYKLDRFKHYVKKAEEAETPRQTESNLKKASKWAEKLAERKTGQEAEKWQRLADKAQEKISTQSTASTSANRENRQRSPGQHGGDVDGSKGPAQFEAPPDLSFDDVGGMNDLISKLREKVIFQLEESQYRDALGVSPTNGLLMHGPPGTGKTYVSKALAGELGYSYAEVKASDILNRYVGETGKAVDALFKQIHENKPCLVFIDEFDSIASNRQSLTGEGGDKAYQQAVSELLQGLEELQDSDAVIVAATNLLDEIDGAILRSGRFDEKIEVPPPNAEARIEILKVHLRERETEGSFDWQNIVEETEGFSAADLAKAVKDAAQQAHIKSVESGSLQPVNHQLLGEALENTEPSLEHWKQ